MLEMLSARVVRLTRAKAKGGPPSGRWRAAPSHGRATSFLEPAASLSGPGGKANHLPSAAKPRAPASLALLSAIAAVSIDGGTASMGGVPSGRIIFFSDPRVTFSFSITRRERTHALAEGGGGSD